MCLAQLFLAYGNNLLSSFCNDSKHFRCFAKKVKGGLEFFTHSATSFLKHMLRTYNGSLTASRYLYYSTPFMFLYFLCLGYLPHHSNSISHLDVIRLNIHVKRSGISKHDFFTTHITTHWRIVKFNLAPGIINCLDIF